MKRFFFHIVTDTSRYEDDTGTVLASLEDVLLHGSVIAKALTKYSCTHSHIAREPRPDDYLEVEDQDSRFVITLPFGRLLGERGRPSSDMSEKQPIDLAGHRVARHYARAIPA